MMLKISLLLETGYTYQVIFLIMFLDLFFCLWICRPGRSGVCIARPCVQELVASLW